jgi:magnesium transporter
MKSRLFYRKARKAGLPPGTLVHVGEKKIEKPRITVLDYNEKELDEKSLEMVEKTFPFRDRSTVSWINIDGLHDVDFIEKIGIHFNIHPLTLEDIVNTDQRPKIEDMGDYIFIILKMISFNNTEKRVQDEQVSFILGKNVVISFQERIGDVFESIRERIRNNKGRIRKMGSDYLVYTLIDAIVDNYFGVLEIVGDQIESMEDEVMTDPTPDTLKTLHKLKRRLLFLRKSVWPLRELINHLERGESYLIKKQTRPYLRDMYDHTIQVVEMLETMRDMNSGMFDMYLSSVSNKMNEVMKVLTIMATIFIPLTFIAGIYGMNFEYMPELKWRFAYFGVWGIMLLAVTGMIIYFKRKKWL